MDVVALVSTTPAYIAWSVLSLSLVSVFSLSSAEAQVLCARVDALREVLALKLCRLVVASEATICSLLCLIILHT